MDLMVVQRRLGFLEASLMRSRLDAANDEVINLFADKQAARSFSLSLSHSFQHLHCMLQQLNASV